MRLLITFARSYPLESAVTLCALLLAAIMEGVSVYTLLPLLHTAIGVQAKEQGGSATAASDATVDPGKLVTDALTALGVAPSLGVLLVVIVCGFVLKSALLLLAMKQVGYTVAHVVTDLRLALFRALLSARWEYYLRQPVGSLANAVGMEAYRASNAYLNSVTVTALMIQVVVYFGVALLISWQATLTAVAASVVLLVTLSRLVGMARRAGKRQTNLFMSLLRRLADSFQSLKPLKAMAREDLVGPVLVTETHRLNKAIRRQVLSGEALRASQDVFLVTLVALSLYVALVHLNLPAATVMVLAVVLARVLGSMGKVQRTYQKMVTDQSAFWSLQTTIRAAEREREAASGGKAPSLDRAIRLDHVSFAYHDSPVLQEACLTIPSGSFTSVFGPSGVGKTTIADLITGLLRPDQGEVCLDDVPLGEINRTQWRRMIGYVPQSALLLHDSVIRNVTLGDPELSETDAEAALKAAGAWEFVKAMPEGMQTSVGERGGALSGGQQQRIAIARALVHRPKLLILDEATSALDPQSEAAICNTLQQLRGALTILAISHQPALVDAADCVYQLHDGTATLIVDRSATSVGVAGTGDEE